MLYFALINYTAHRKKCAISRQSSASSTRPVATKQPGPKASRLPHLRPDAAASLQDAAVRDTIDLKKRLVDTLASIPQCIVDETVDQWTARLRACVKAKGRQFEHLLQ